MSDREQAEAGHFFTQSETVRQIVKKMNDKRERVHDLSGVHYPPDQECRMAAWALEGLLAERDAAIVALRDFTDRADRADRAEAERDAAMAEARKARARAIEDAALVAANFGPEDVNKEFWRQYVGTAIRALAYTKAGKG